jgi:hypothetical protein
MNVIDKLSSMKIYLAFCLILLYNSFVFAQNKLTYINPTGIYKMGGGIKQGVKVYGYYGEIYVKLLSRDSIAMSFNICKGEPNYSTGSFIDTLLYVNNTAIYKDASDSCKIVFIFSKFGIKTKDKTVYSKNVLYGNYSNCWGAGVDVDDRFYKKVSSKKPLIKLMFGE